MPDPATLAPISAFAGWTPPKSPAFTATVCDNLTIASLSPFAGNETALSNRLREAYGIGLPSAGKRNAADPIALQWIGPSQWLAIADRSVGRDLETELAPLCAGLAALTDQSDARAALSATGPATLAVLAKGVPLDLHPRVFLTGNTASTHASHIGITIAKLDEVPTFQILLYRSFALSFANWLTHSAAEFA